MGLMRFVVPDRQALPADAVERAYMTGLDEIPWQSRTEWTDNGLVIRRVEHDSGNFHVPWHVPGWGELTLGTACLMEREAPYHLAVELARGTVHRLRNQYSLWQSAGLFDGETHPLIAKALQLLSHAVTLRDNPAAAEERAQATIAAALTANDQLTRQFVEKTQAARKKQSPRSGAALGVNLGGALFGEAVGRYVVNTFNSGVVPFTWSEIETIEGKPDWSIVDRQIEWCRANGLKVIAGPLLAFDRYSLPPWLYLYEDDLEAVAAHVDDYIRAVVSRYKGRVQVWQAGSRLNVGNAMRFEQEEKLRLAALAIHAVRAVDERTPIILSLDQPWGEFMRNDDCDYSPLHFADTLVRSDLGLTGLGLEINLDYATEATQPRDGMDVLRQIDRWSSLGMPLVVSLTAPSDTVADPKARMRTAPLPITEPPLDQIQSQWIKSLVPVLLSKPVVQAIIWNQLLDSAPHERSHAGLFDAQNQPKPAAQTMREIRTKFLPPPV
jgi:hypothetical protein